MMFRIFMIIIFHRMSSQSADVDLNALDKSSNFIRWRKIRTFYFVSLLFYIIFRNASTYFLTIRPSLNIEFLPCRIKLFSQEKLKSRLNSTVMRCLNQLSH